MNKIYVKLFIFLCKRLGMQESLKKLCDVHFPDQVVTIYASKEDLSGLSEEDLEREVVEEAVERQDLEPKKILN